MCADEATQPVLMSRDLDEFDRNSDHG